MARIWSWDEIKPLADDDEEIVIMLRSGSAAFLLAALQPMAQTWLWSEYGDATKRDEIEAIIGQVSEDIMTPIDLFDCEDMADCFETSENVWESFKEVGNTTNQNTASGGSTEDILVTEIIEDNLIPEDAGCDRDNMFGMAREIVWSIHKATVEVFELIEVTTNPAELAAEVADNIPGVGLIGGTGLDIVTWIQDSAYELYELAWSDAVWDSIACQVFCKMIDNGGCEISYKDLIEIYALPFAEIPEQGSSLDEILEFIMELTITANETGVKTCDMFGMTLMNYGGKFGQFVLGVHSLETVIQLAMDESDEDHTILCTECADTWTMRADLDVAALPTWVTVDQGSFVAYSGIEFGCSGGTPQTKEGKARITIPSPFECTALRVDYRYTLGSTSGSSVNQAVIDGTSGSGYEPWEIWEFGEVLTGVGEIHCTAEALEVESIRYRIRSSRNACDGSGELLALYVCGVGDNPFAELDGWEADEWNN